MKIQVGEIYSRVEDYKLDPAGLAAIRQLCRARPENYQFMPKFRKGYWDGYISLMKSINAFPTGLLPMVLNVLDRMGRNYELNYNYVRGGHFPIPDNCLRGIILRGYQIDAAESLLRAERGIAKMATGSGKTEVIAAMLWSLRCPQTLIAVRTKDLLHQTAKRLELRLGMYVGVIGDSVYNTSDQINVATIQTLARNLDAKFWATNQVVIADECHHVSGKEMLDVLYKIPGRWRYGFSGTPLKYDLLADMKLISITGDIVYEISNDYMIQSGYSARPLVRIAVMEDGSADHFTMDYADAHDALIVHNRDRNFKIAKMARKSTGTVLILVNRLDHGQLLYKAIPHSVFVHGSDTSERRSEVLDQMRNGSGIFIATPIFDEGVDVPNIDTLILADGGSSSNKLLQRIGRGLRHKEGANTLTIYDFIDDTNIYLLRHSSNRIDTYVNEGFDTDIIESV